MDVLAKQVDVRHAFLAASLERRGHARAEASSEGRAMCAVCRRGV
jgi:hypothetical protein